MKSRWIDLIMYILNFFFNRKKFNDQKRRKEKERINNKLKNVYEDIDSEKEEKKKKDVKERLDNMF